MKNFYLKHYVTGSLIAILMLTAGLANAQNTITVSGAGDADVDGTYTYQGISNSRPYYTMGIYRLEYLYSIEADDYLWKIYPTSGPNTNQMLYYFWDQSSTPVNSDWYNYYGTYPAPTLSNQVAFTNGSSYTAPTPTPGTNNNPIGRFLLDPGAEGVITVATVQFSGTPTGITAVKLWSSADASFNSASDVQLSSKTYASSVTFNGFNSPMALSGTYYFITADLASNASGNVTSTIANAAAFTISSGSVITSISNASLASGSVPLPVQLLSFTAQSKQDAVILNWSTVKEESFAGFEPERSGDGSSWTKLAFIAGNANSITTNTYYAYTDNNPVSGHTYYRLKMVDADGGFTYSKQLTVIKNDQNASLQNYPNPFNKTTLLTFQLPVNSFANLKVFNNMGVEVNTLINKQLNAGSYTVPFDGSALAAGLYYYTLRYGKEKISGTMLLNK
jgi:hypothetical protein